MTTKKLPAQKSPWLTVTLGVLGLIIGYGLVLQQTGGFTAMAGNAYSCPMKKEACTGTNCAKNTICSSGVCNANCPGNCHHS